MRYQSSKIVKDYSMNVTYFGNDARLSRFESYIYSSVYIILTKKFDVDLLIKKPLAFHIYIYIKLNKNHCKIKR